MPRKREGFVPLSDVAEAVELSGDRALTHRAAASPARLGGRFTRLDQVTQLVSAREADPDLPGCVATGISREEAVREIGQAIRLHIESLREHGEPVPEPHCTAIVVTVAAAAG